MKRSDIEIMAPVGSYESLAAAIQAGAKYFIVKPFKEEFVIETIMKYLKK